MRTKNAEKIRKIVATALMAALVFIFTYIHFDIPTPLGKTMIHFGNIMCLLSGMLFGPVIGGLSAGLGSMFFDMFDPVYLPECWITFINKFVMGLVAGLIAHSPALKKLGKWRYAIAAVCGALSYVVLYLGKTLIVNYYVLGAEWQTVAATLVTKGTVTLVNGCIAAVCSTLLNLALRPAMQRAGITEKLGIKD